MEVVIPKKKGSTLVNIDGEFYEFCQTSTFENYMLSAFKKWDLENKIKKGVREELHNNRQVRDIVKSEAKSEATSEANRVATKIVTDQLTNYTTIQIPSHVAKAMSDQFAGFINNYTQVQSILNTHLTNVDNLFHQRTAQQLETLETQTRDTLTRIVSDPNYQVLTEYHIGVVKQKFLDQMHEQQQKFDSELKKFNRMVTDELKIVTQTNQRAIEADTKAISLKQVTDKLEKKVEKLESENFLFKVSTFLLAGVGAFCLSQILK